MIVVILYEQQEQEQELLKLRYEADRRKKKMKTITDNLKTENTNKNNILQEMWVLSDQLEEMHDVEQRGDSARSTDQIVYIHKFYELLSHCF